MTRATVVPVEPNRRIQPPRIVGKAIEMLPGSFFQWERFSQGELESVSSADFWRTPSLSWQVFYRPRWNICHDTRADRCLPPMLIENGARCSGRRAGRERQLEP
jgi:hypothetical protein